MPGHPLDYDPYPTVNPAGGRAPGLSIDASAEKFGASVGQATAGLGQAVQKVGMEGLEFATQQAEIDARTHAAELHTWTSKQVTDVQEKYLGLRGRAALDGLPQYRDELDSIFTQAKSQATNPATQRIIDDQSRRMMESGYATGARHASTQRKQWETTTATNSALTYGSRAVFDASNAETPAIGDDLGVQRNLANSDNEVRNLFAGQGYEGPAIDAEVLKNRGRNVEAIVKQTITDQSPTGVRRAFEFYKAQEEKIDAASRVQIQNALRGPLNTIAGQRIGDEMMGRAPAAIPPEVISEVPANFVAAIRNTEGFAPKAKWDYKQFTNGFGTKANSPDEVIDQATAAARFNDKIKQAAKFVDGVNPNLDAGSRAALISVTFNAGEGWGDAGLGAKVRAGDMQGAKELFLQYNKAGGETHEGLVMRRAREASWFGQGDIPASAAVAPMRSKGDVVLRILDDPNMKERPQVQAAALAHVNRIYSAYELQATQDRAGFDLKVKNSTAEALSTGKVTTPLTQEQFLQSYGPKGGDAAWSEYQANVQLGTDMRATASMAPADLTAMRERYKPQPGDTFVAQQKRLSVLDKAIESNQTALKDDPAAFLIARTDTGAETWKQFQTLVSAQDATPELRTQYAAMYAQKMIAEQQRLGVPADQVRVVPDSYVQSLNAKLTAPALNGGTGVVSQTIAAEAKLWGDHWPNVYRQLSKDAAPVVRVIGSGVQSQAAQLLTDLAPLSLADILRDQNAERSTTIKKDVLDAFKPLAASMAGNEGATGIFNDFRGQAEKLAAKYVMGGATSSEAAAKAFEQLVGFKYSFQDGYRVPKDAGVTPDQIARGTVEAKRTLKDIGVKAAADTFGGLSAEYLLEGKIASLQRDGKWVTSPDEKGLMLVHGDLAVRSASGQPLTLTWKQLGAMGDDMKKRQDKAQEQFLTLGPFPRG